MFGTLPGLTGDWWFDETPWLIPQVRQRWLPYLQKGSTLTTSSDAREFQNRLDELTALANGSDVFEFQRQLHLLATESLPDRSHSDQREEITMLCSLLETSDNPQADNKRLKTVRDLLLQKVRPTDHRTGDPDLEKDLEKLSAADCHLLAAVLQRMAMNSNVVASTDVADTVHLNPTPAVEATAAQEKLGSTVTGDVQSRDLLWSDCRKAYEASLKKYEKDADQSMAAVCRADLGRCASSKDKTKMPSMNFDWRKRRCRYTNVRLYSKPLCSADKQMRIVNCQNISLPMNASSKPKRLLPYSPRFIPCGPSSRSTRRGTT